VVSDYLRRNALGLVAIFIALGGTAFALPGTNSVNSGDIVNGQVKARDIGAQQVRASKLASGAVTGGKVLDNSLTGADVNEATLTTRPIAIDLSESESDSDQPSQQIGDLEIDNFCNTSATRRLTFYNRNAQSTASLNWFYGDGTTTSANGEYIAAPSPSFHFKDFFYASSRIEGQFIFHTPLDTITVNLHASDVPGDRCEVNGTAIFAPAP
jgi:hypothetical protein